MATNHTPTTTPLPAAAAALSPDDRFLLQLLFHDAATSLSQIAEHLDIDLLELTSRILAEPFQAALAAIEQAAAAVARARALVNGATAVNALTAATAENPSFAERRRAGAALLRFAPPQPATPPAAATPVATPALAPPADAPAAQSDSTSASPTAQSPPRIPDSTSPPETFPISSTASAQHTPTRNARDRPAAAVA